MVLLGLEEGLEGLSDCADLVHLDADARAGSFLACLLDALVVGDGDVVSDNGQLGTHVPQHDPVVVVVLVEGVNYALQLIPVRWCDAVIGGNSSYFFFCFSFIFSLVCFFCFSFVSFSIFHLFLFHCHFYFIILL